jgi:hypothetical protein
LTKITLIHLGGDIRDYRGGISGTIGGDIRDYRGGYQGLFLKKNIKKSISKVC